MRENFLPKRLILILFTGLINLVLLATFLLLYGNDLGYLRKIFINSRTLRVHSIVLKDDGFFPRELTINKGEAVKFSTSSEKAFWPASNVHPNHNIYPEFDPKKPIKPDEDWSFKFDRAGDWKYHDHLNPLFKGLIKVADEKSELKSAKPFDNCINQVNKEQCWENLIETAMEKEGISKAFDIIGELYNSDEKFAQDCHGYVHFLGEEAYIVFSRDKNAAILSPKASYCGFGFYHGFMEKMFFLGGSVEEARQFCAHSGNKLALETIDAEGACYHGIGHGAVDGSDPRARGNAQAIIEPGLKLCEKVAPTDVLLNRCSSGVFNSLAIMLIANQNGLFIDEKDPMKICGVQSNRIFKKTCYQEMNTLLLTMEGLDFRKAANWILQIADGEDAVSAMDSLGQYAAKFRETGSDHSEHVLVCREFSEKLHLACIGGYSAGIIEFGTPGEGYIESLKFCNATILTSVEMDACHQRLLWMIYVTYPKEKYEKICNTINDKYKKLCRVN